jgi:tetratricopeptide (TPR) repeat protein
MVRPWNIALKRLVLMPLLLLGLGGCATNEAVTWFNEGLEASDGDKKITYFTKAIDLNHEMTAAFKNRARAYKDLGRAEKADADQKIAKALDRFQSAAIVNRGIAYKNKGQIDRAIQDYEKSLTLKPDFAQAYGNRGVAYSLKGLHDKAIADQTKAISLAETDGDERSLVLAYLNRGDDHQKKGSYNLTIRDVNKARKLYPNNAHARAHLAWVRATAPDEVFQSGKMAVELAEGAVALGRDAFNLDVLAAAYAEMGRFDDAIETLSEVNALLQKRGGEGSEAEFEKHLMRYRAGKPWRMTSAADGPDYTTSVIKLNYRAGQFRAEGKQEEAGRLESQALAIARNGRRLEAARKRQRQQIEALSGRYTTAGGRSRWQITFKYDRFVARYIGKTGNGTLLYGGTVTGTEIKGLAYHYATNFCRKSKTTPLRGRINLGRRSFEVSTEKFDILERTRNKNCVPEMNKTEWLQKNRH